MKKFLSILLAAIMVCSMGIFAFAAEEEAVAAEDTTAAVAAADEKEEAPAEEVAAADEKTTVAAAGDLTALEKKIASKGLDSSDMVSLLSSAISSIGKNLKEISVNDILNLPANIMDDVVTYIFAGLKALGVDVDALYAKLSSNKIINWFVNTFYKGKALTTTAVVEPEAPSEIPQTGSAASIAVFATLSLAAGAAFVSFKKKEA
jgi:LPXTG-motif cell wall-anchored protein